MISMAPCFRHCVDVFQMAQYPRFVKKANVQILVRGDMKADNLYIVSRDVERAKNHAPFSLL